jgi:hypothetical protein
VDLEIVAGRKGANSTRSDPKESRLTSNGAATTFNYEWGMIQPPSEMDRGLQMMPQEEQQLLAHGIAEYVDVLNAMNAFRSLVQGKCRRVVDDNLEDYAAALGIQLSKSGVMDHEGSYGSEFSLGFRLVLKAGPYTALGHGVSWRPAKGGGLEIVIYMGVWSRQRNVTRLKEVLRKKKVDYEEEGQDVWLEEELNALDVGQIDIKLDVLMEKWISLWRQAGGIKALGGKSQ